MAVMSEAEKVSELHLEVKASLMNEDFEKIKNWQKEAFHKQMMGGFKETKEAEDGFRKAQKPWAKKLKEVPSSHRALSWWLLQHCSLPTFSGTPVAATASRGKAIPRPEARVADIYSGPRHGAL
jgi:hypothetical protein